MTFDDPEMTTATAATWTNPGRAIGNHSEPSRDAHAAATPGKGASMQTNEQTTNTPAPYKAKRKDAARRKERRKARKAAQKTEAHFAKQGVPREIRKWLHF